MTTKILLPVLLIVSSVAGDEINDLCLQLTTQINQLQKLVPLEVDVIFPRSDVVNISMPSKYRLASPLLLKEDCSSTPVSGSTKTKIMMKLKNNKSYIISPKMIFTVSNPSYNLELDVEHSETEETTQVTLVDFSIENKYIVDETNQTWPALKDFINTNLSITLKKKLKQMLDASFKPDENIEISSSLVQDLLVNIFQVAAQDF